MAEQGYNLEQTGQEVQGALNKIISISPATEEAPGLMSAEDKAKLDGITPANFATKEELASKVDKETGKGLSTNDFTNANKEAVEQAMPLAIQLLMDRTQDIDTIRAGAAAGATAYQKPRTGIPATDLASAVQTSLGKADTALQQSDLEPIKEVIPDAATTQNKLADKAFVNSSIATATATFRGAYNLVTDLSLTVSATQSQIATALAGAISTADNNDYAFVQVPTADVTPTEIARVERYKYNGSAWAFEYALNNSGFTASQWAALNSGITSGLVAKLSALPTNSELTTLLAGKQDTISDLAAIRTGAGLGATAYQKPQSGIPASDLASGVIPDVTGKADKSDTPRVVSFQQDLDELPGEIIEELRLGDIVSCLGEPYEVVAMESAKIQLSVGGWFYEFVKTNDVWSYSTQGADLESARFNKVTSLSAQSTDTEYPSAKAVVDYVEEHGGGGGAGIDEVTQPVVSTENGGTNTVRITLTNGEHYDVYIKNGKSSAGLFPDAATLVTAQPSPSVGDYAFVGSGFPADIYICQTAGTWNDSGEDYNGDNIDLTDYATEDELEELEARTAGAECIADVVENGFFIVDEQMNIGFRVDNYGAHAKNIVGFQN